MIELKNQVIIANFDKTIRSVSCGGERILDLKSEDWSIAEVQLFDGENGRTQRVYVTIDRINKQEGA